MQLYNPDGQIVNNLKGLTNVAIFSGSFNPLHDGHKALYDIVTSKGYNVIFEISKKRYKKKEYTPNEIAERVEQFAWYAPVLVTDAVLFTDKLKLLKESNPTFIMGYDTLDRWLQSYDDVSYADFKIITTSRMINNINMNPSDIIEDFHTFKYEVINETTPNVSSTQLREDKLNDKVVKHIHNRKGKKI